MDIYTIIGIIVTIALLVILTKGVASGLKTIYSSIAEFYKLYLKKNDDDDNYDYDDDYNDYDDDYYYYYDDDDDNHDELKKTHRTYLPKQNNEHTGKTKIEKRL